MGLGYSNGTVVKGHDAQRVWPIRAPDWRWAALPRGSEYAVLSLLALQRSEEMLLLGQW